MWEEGAPRAYYKCRRPKEKLIKEENAFLFNNFDARKLHASGCKAGALPVVFVDVDAGFPHVDS